MRNICFHEGVYIALCVQKELHVCKQGLIMCSSKEDNFRFGSMRVESVLHS